MISVGEQINTNFTIKAVHEGQEQEVLFSELLTNPTIVSVYMKNNTGSCDKQTASLAEHASWFADQGYDLMALSKDTCGSHKKYADKQGISFTLLSDPDHAFAKATQSMVEKKMYGKVYEAPSRSAFVIDTDGTILAVIEKVNTKAHAEELKELVESL
jgi:peroxiredoxin Q/BCP